MQEYGRVILTVLVIILLPSCALHSKKIRKAASKRAAFSMSSIQTQIDVEQSAVELEAKLTDIPTLIGSRTISIYQISEQPQQLRLALECDQSMLEVYAYYAEQMLYNGWQQITAIKDTSEIMQVYKKPSKICVIIFKHKNSKSVQIALTISEISKDL